MDAHISLATAQSMGADTANEWINRDKHTSGTAAEWRAKMLAAFVLDVQHQDGFLQPVKAWETGFDEVMRAPDFARVLANLDGYLSACGYGADHPWRREILAALNAIHDAPCKAAPEATPAPRAASSFVDTYGATVTIPAGEVANYAGCKAEHLRAITQLLAASAGGGVDLAESAVADFSVIANALACEMESLIGILQAEIPQGGADA